MKPQAKDPFADLPSSADPFAAAPLGGGDPFAGLSSTPAASADPFAGVPSSSGFGASPPSDLFGQVPSAPAYAPLAPASYNAPPPPPVSSPSSNKQTKFVLKIVMLVLTGLWFAACALWVTGPMLFATAATAGIQADNSQRMSQQEKNQLSGLLYVVFFIRAIPGMCCMTVIYSMVMVPLFIVYCVIKV